MHAHKTPIADFIIMLMNTILWTMIVSAIGIILVMMLVMIIALTFVFFDIALDWSWILTIF
tara:strand:+ start:1420 stop:1602 length:183 start_codon:yes stop_codon:yes gene_type:complete